MCQSGSRWWLKHYIPATHLRDPDEILDSWLWPSPFLAVVGIWGVNQWKDRCLSLSLCISAFLSTFQINLSTTTTKQLSLHKGLQVKWSNLHSVLGPLRATMSRKSLHFTFWWELMSSGSPDSRFPVPLVWRSCHAHLSYSKHLHASRILSTG